MKNFCEGFCKTTGVIVGFLATMFTIAWMGEHWEDYN